MPPRELRGEGQDQGDHGVHFCVVWTKRDTTIKITEIGI